MWRLYPGGGGGGGGRRSLRVRASCDGRYQQGQQCRTTCGGDTIRGIVSYGTCEERKEEEGGEEGRGGEGAAAAGAQLGQKGAVDGTPAMAAPYSPLECSRSD